MDKNKVISLYIHIPFCVSKCSYCDFFSIPTCTCKNAVACSYVDALCSEIKYRLEQYKTQAVKTVFIGGGTPSLLTENQIIQISDTIKQFGLTSDYEFTFEVNPDDVSKELLLCLEKAGVNRISCGIQSFSEDVLKSVHRRADSRQNYDCFTLFKNFWNKKLSVDLICGLPCETQASMLQGLEYLINQKVAHISFYSLCVEEETPLGNAIIKGAQKYDEDFTDELWVKGRDFLLKNGYDQYEVSNFALPENECLHNMTYWTHKDYIGCGSGATGTLYGEGLRYTNIKNPEEYCAFWNQNQAEIAKNIAKIPQDVEKIRQKTAEFEYFMMGLRTKRGIFPTEYEEIFGRKMPADLLKKLESSCKKSEKGSFYLEKDRLLFLNSFLEDLLDYIN